MSHIEKIAVVTGGARGLGRSIAMRLAKDGASVSVWDLNFDGAEETASAIRHAGGRAIGCACDVSSADSVATAIARTRSELGPVTILVNNAGLSPFMKFADATEENWDSLMAINLKSLFLCSKAAIPDMLSARWGRIINISSSAAQTGYSPSVQYAASKGGVIGFTKSLAIEYAASGITVNAVPPGFVDTEGLRESTVDVDTYAPTTPMKRAGEPRHIAGAVAYLVSDDADYVTGHTLSVNGGRYTN